MKLSTCYCQSGHWMKNTGVVEADTYGHSNTPDLSCIIQVRWIHEKVLSYSPRSDLIEQTLLHIYKDMRFSRVIY